MLIPLPSPTGRNNARLFATGRVARALGAAYDAKGGLAYGSRRPARDQDPPPPDDTGSMHGQDPDEGLAQIKIFLKNRLDPQDFDRLEQMLAALNGGGEEDDGGQDEPQPFRGRPSGGRVRMDEEGEPELLPTRGKNIPPEWHREFPDSPVRDGRFAQDSADSDYHRVFGNRHVVTDNYGG